MGGDIYNTSLVGGEQKTSLEIPYSSLNFTSPKPPNPVKVDVVVLAIGEMDIIGKGQRQLRKYFYCFKVARSDFWVTIPFKFDQLLYYHQEFYRKSIVIAELEKDQRFR